MIANVIAAAAAATTATSATTATATKASSFLSNLLRGRRRNASVVVDLGIAAPSSGGRCVACGWRDRPRGSSTRGASTMPSTSMAFSPPSPRCHRPLPIPQSRASFSSCAFSSPTTGRRHFSTTSGQRHHDATWSPIAEEGAAMRTTTTTPSWFPPQSRHRPYDRRMLRLRMAPNYGTEGFRDAVRGGQEYIKSRGGGGGGGGGGVGRGSGGGGRNDDRDPEQRRTRQRRQQLQQQEQQQQQQPQPVDASAAAPRKIPFPKLTPGRERNYRPPHVVSAMLQRQELMRFDEDEDDYGTKDYCDGTSSNEEHCLENFRDGRESARYLSVGGPAGGGGGVRAARVRPTLRREGEFRRQPLRRR